MILLDLLRGHGIDAVPEPGGVLLAGRGSRALGTIGRVITGPAATTVQLDVRFDAEPGRTIVESFAGIGRDRAGALADAWQEFALGSFHPIVATFVRPGDDPEVDSDTWTIGGRGRRVTLGTFRTRGAEPPGGWAPDGWFGPFRAAVEASDLPTGAHWIRLYYARTPGQDPTCEVLLDNETWEGVRAATARAPWPSADSFYSVRVFLVVRDEPPPPPAAFGEPAPLGIGEIVARAVTVFAADASADDPALAAALVREGFAPEMAPGLVEFMPLGFARALLSRMGVRCADEYTRVDPSGRERARGRLDDEPIYRHALALAPGVVAESEVYFSVAGRSAELGAATRAANAGSRPQDVVLAPPALPWHDAGEKPARKFWKFWK